MDTPLNATANTAGGLLSSSTFEVPPYQREYSWHDEEVKEFFYDIQRSLDDETYFLGLVILTEENGRKKIVDGQQRIVTLTLLATTLYHEAKRRGRSALADRLKADFLTSINYETDASDPRVVLTDNADNATLQFIISNGEAPPQIGDEEAASTEIIKSFKTLSRLVREDLNPDPFRRLGKWTEFITHKLYFAVFVHPNPSSAYQVFEVINTRGRDLTTADLLKNFIISQSLPANRDEVYTRWKEISSNFQTDGNNSFVQYIRHVVTVNSGHILPKELFAFLASRNGVVTRQPPSPVELIGMLDGYLPLYAQMIDPSLAGPATEFALRVFAALNRLNIITVRPLMMSIVGCPEPDEGLKELLKLVVHRVVVGTLGTGNIERRFAEAAKKVKESGNWKAPLAELQDLNPDSSTFVEQLKKRALNKGVLTVIRNSVISGDVAPSRYYYIHFIAPKTSKGWYGFAGSELAFGGATVGNTFLSKEEKRSAGADTWQGFKQTMLNDAAPNEMIESLSKFEVWDAEAIGKMAAQIASIATKVWYGS